MWVGAPVRQNGLHPAPGFFLFVTAHKQVQPASNHVQQQALVGAHAFGAKALVKVQVEVYRCQGGLGLVLRSALRQQMRLQSIATR